jgi:hypothetical protein
VEIVGMYNELNNISRAVSGQALELKKTQQQQKQAEYIKSELKSMLQSELMDLDNIFNDDIKAIAIENVLNNTIILLYNKEFTRQFLNDKYYTVARQVEQIKKKTSEETSRQQQLKNDILYIKKQQEAEKLKKLQRQNMQRQQVQQPQKSSGGMQILGIILTIICFPIGLLILSILAAASKQK